MTYTTKRLRASSRAKTRPRSSDCPPVDFDAAAMPILGTHWYGLQPDVARQLQYQRQVEHLHRLGPRAIGELIREVAAGEDLDSALAAYQRLTPSLLKALGGDRFPPTPVHEV